MSSCMCPPHEPSVVFTVVEPLEGGFLWWFHLGLLIGGGMHSQEPLFRGAWEMSAPPPPSCLPQSSGRWRGDGFLPGFAGPALGIIETCSLVPDIKGL